MDWGCEKEQRRFLGKSVEVLVEGTDPKGHLKGRLKTQAPEIDGSVILRGEAKPGDWVMARITRTLPYDLMGEIERPEKKRLDQT